MKQFMLAALLASTATIALTDDSQVPYPEGYRDWHHVKSMVIEEGHPLYGAFGGIHHLYANDTAMEGYLKGAFPDGSVIVFDLLESVQNGNAEFVEDFLGLVFVDIHLGSPSGNLLSKGPRRFRSGR